MAGSMKLTKHSDGTVSVRMTRQQFGMLNSATVYAVGHWSAKVYGPPLDLSDYGETREFAAVDKNILADSVDLSDEWHALEARLYNRES